MRISHYCRKVEWALRHHGIPYDAVEVSFRHLADFTDVNPEGTVPVLVADGGRICGSQEILRWLDQRHGGLYPEPGVAEWESWADETIGPVARRLAYRALYERPSRYGHNPAVWAIARAARPLILGVLKSYQARRHYEADEAALPDIYGRIAAQAGDGFLFGDAPTAADYACAALVAPLLPIRGPETDHPAVPALRRYVRRVRERGGPRKRVRLTSARRAHLASLPISRAR